MLRTSSAYYVHMMRRTTVELDDELLAKAKRALGLQQTKETLHAALRRVVDDRAAVDEDLRERQRDYLEFLHAHVDLDVLDSDDMWR